MTLQKLRHTFERFLFAIFVLLNCTAFATTINTGSCTVTQVFGASAAGATNQELLQIKIVTSGGGAAATICNFSFVMQNTNNADVTTAKLMYTGTSASFVAPVLLSSVTNPSGTINLSAATQSLANGGPYYFWLVFDISSTAGLCSKFDAYISTNGIEYRNAGTACPSGLFFTPLTPNPDGFRNTDGPDCWTQKTSFSGAARYAAASFSIGNKVYTGGGYDGTNYYSDFYEWDPATNTWASKAAIPGQARYGASGFNIGTKGYLFGGYWLGTYYGFLYEYDPAANTWTAKASIPDTLREYASAFVIGTKAYIVAGYNNSYTPNTMSNVWEWDQAGNTWTSKARLTGGARYAGLGFAINGKGYVGLGTNSVPASLNDFWEYDPTLNNWTQKATFTGGARNTPSSFNIGVRGYVTSGNTGTPQNDVYQYNPINNTWTQLNNNGAKVRANAPSASSSTSGKGYMGCGWTTGSVNLSDFWEYTAPNTIDISSVSSTNLCAGTSVTVSFSVVGTFLSSNIFKLELSDSAGGFSAPVILGTLSSASPAPITATIPSNTMAGSGYRVRVNATSWPTTGTDNQTNITINSLSQIPDSVTASPGIVCSGGTSTLIVNGGLLGTAAQWKWYTLSCGGSPTGTGSTLVVNPSSTTTYYVRAEGTCNTTSCISEAVTIPSNGGVGTWLWLGASTDWFDPCNWDKKCLPDASSDVSIPGGTTYNPTISGGTGSCKTISINTGNGGHLTINTAAWGYLNVAQ